jgi:hypothetical protein
VFVYSRFVENPLIDPKATNPSFLRWFCHKDFRPVLGRCGQHSMSCHQSPLASQALEKSNLMSFLPVKSIVCLTLMFLEASAMFFKRVKVF